MDELKTFENPYFGKIRSLEIDGEPWLAGADVAAALGYANTKDALQKHVDDEDKRIVKNSDLRPLENHLPKSVFPINFVRADLPNRGLTFINESGLYSLIFSSKLPSAKAFKHWVTSEVLPSIRKTGRYAMPGAADIRPGEEFDFLAATVERRTRFNHYVERICRHFGWKRNYFLHGIYTLMTREGCDVERLTIFTQLAMHDLNLSAASAVTMDEQAFELFCKIAERGIKRNNIPDFVEDKTV